MQCEEFQKQSPYLEEMNHFINLAEQMGLIKMSYLKDLPNSTECNTIADVYKTHTNKNRTVRVKVNDIYGMLILLGLGVGGALITFTAEIILLVRTFTLTSCVHKILRLILFCQLIMQTMRRMKIKITGMKDRRHRFRWTP